MDKQNSDQTLAEMLFKKRCTLYVALAVARGVGNQAAACELMNAIERYTDDPRLVEIELRQRGLIDLSTFLP